MVGDLAGICRRVIDSFRGAQEVREDGRTRVGSLFRAGVDQISGRVSEIQSSCLSDSSELIEASAVRETVRSLPPGSLLTVGNSLPIRVLEEWGGGRPDLLHVDCQRGLNGIDGLVAGFAGLVAGLERRAAPDAISAAVLVLGDVSALHDLGGFSALAEIRSTPCAVVVLNNDGGRIFEQLPIQSSPLWQAETASGPGRNYWLTSHGLGFSPIADFYGLRYSSPETVESLVAELRDLSCSSGEGSQDTTSSSRGSGVRLIELPVLPSGHLELTQNFELELRRHGLAKDRA